ncbi:AAA family ATPase [Desulfomonile tiedjei]|uniref:Putative ATPase n=1 Tax=Desulfomonile tiedjei (strain ATCC 49306 / DSM 6799 / DCB-1) TaxID=706587 RepID=I4C1P8_DESTA|nr:AAA family ATPase [Desulfomonile tiedjei]AFM23489.1 putative ATPase [Desulfomonile tiedjei DSM 6799]
MLQRLYVHNFRCLENFELPTKELSSALLIGKNGTGKSTIGIVLETLQGIARGRNRVGELVEERDFAGGRSDVPIRFELEVILGGKLFTYMLVLELPERFRELRVAEEQLLVSGDPVYSRREAQVILHETSQNIRAQFLMDWHLVALPVIQEQSEQDPLHHFRTWLARTVILAPIPVFMTGDASGDTLLPKRDGSNFGEWFSGLLGHYPAAYTKVEQFLKDVMPDIRDFEYERVGKDFKTMIVWFERKKKLDVKFERLSDGEKCFFLCAAALAANELYGPLFCFWDEPDNYLSLSEIGFVVAALRRSFGKSGQILITSHNPEAIRGFSDDNTFVLDRKSHLEPTVIRPLSDIPVKGDLVNAIIRGDVFDEHK